jgi:hypothetical protein
MLNLFWILAPLLAPLLAVSKQFTVTTTQFFPDEHSPAMSPCSFGQMGASPPVELVEEGTRHIVRFSDNEYDNHHTSVCRVMTVTLNGKQIYGNHADAGSFEYTFYVEFLVDRDLLLEVFVCPSDPVRETWCATGTTDVMNLPRAPPGSPRYDYSTVKCPRKEHCIINPPSRTRQTEEAFDETKIYYNEDLVTLESHYSGRGLFMARTETIAGIAPDNRESYWMLLTPDWEYDWRAGDYAKDRVVWHRLARWRSQYITHVEPGTEIGEYGSWRLEGTVETFTATTEVRGDKECAPNKIAPVNQVFMSHEVVVFSAKTDSSCTIRSYSIQGVEYPEAVGQSSFDTSVEIQANLVAIVDFALPVHFLVTTVLEGSAECMKDTTASPINAQYEHHSQATFRVLAPGICTIASFSINGVPVQEATDVPSVEKTVTVDQDTTAVAVLRLTANSAKFSIDAASTCPGVIVSPAPDVLVVDGTVVEFHARTDTAHCLIQSFVVAGQSYPAAEGTKDYARSVVVSDNVVGSVLFRQMFQVTIEIDAQSECGGQAITCSSGWYDTPVTTAFDIEADKLCYIESFTINGVHQSPAEGFDVYSSGAMVVHTETRAVVLLKRSYYVVRTNPHPGSGSDCLHPRLKAYIGPRLQYVATGQEAGVYYGAKSGPYTTCVVCKAWIDGIEQAKEEHQPILNLHFTPAKDTTVELLVVPESYCPTISAY